MQAACVVVGVGVGCMQAACNPGSVQRALFQTCMLAMCRRTFLSAAAFQKYARHIMHVVPTRSYMQTQACTLLL